MRKVNLLWAFTLLLVICLSSCSSEPKNAQECVMQFLQYLKENKVRKGDEISAFYGLNEIEKFCYDKYRTNTAFNVAQKYAPQWEPEKVVLDKDVYTFYDNSDYSFSYSSYNQINKIHALYDNKDVIFYIDVITNGDNKEYKLLDFEGFLNTDTIITVPYGVEIKKGTNCADIHFLQYSDNIVEIVSCVNEFNKSVTNRKPSYKFYPEAKNFGNYIIVDSVAPVVQSVTVNLDKRFYLENYKVQCTGGKIFYVDKDYNDTSSYIIKNSIGLYKYQKKIADICTKYNYEYKVSDKPKTDVDAWILVKDVAKKAKSVEKKRIAEEKRRKAEEEKRKAEEEKRAYRQSRVNYYRKVGLVIKDIRMTKGKDKDGDPIKGVDIEIFNPTNKTIKYLIIYVAALNRVNDVISRKTCRGIGPIEPLSTYSYNFDDVFYDYNDIVDDISVNIELQYTDGSRKSVKWKDAQTTGGFDAKWWYDY